MEELLINIDTQISILSGEHNIYKTEGFVKQTARLLGVDFLIGKLAEGLIFEEDSVSRFLSGNKNAPLYLRPIDDSFCLYLSFGSPNKEPRVTDNDIIFYGYKYSTEDKADSSRALSALLADKRLTFRMGISDIYPTVNDFYKLYRLSNFDQVNFPLLSERQQNIVSIEDENVLVQGVAGSGKTNVCIDKIIYTACREYHGRTLYTTFSRGLLNDTKSKVEIFRLNLASFLREMAEDRVIFMDKNHKKAIESRLGLYFSCDDDDKIIKKIERIIEYLEFKVDYFLIEDIYRSVYGEYNLANEQFFIKNYIADIKNHQLAGKLEKVKNLTYEVIYKEIFGMIFGVYDYNNPRSMLTLEEYKEKRKESFTIPECETVYSLATDYAKYLNDNNMTDNNFMSRALIGNFTDRYSLAVVDEVQDFTEVNLYFLRKTSRKMFCVGDASQMINPTYFSFSYLKRLLYEKNIISVAQLENNYRNTKKIADIVENLSEINIEKFGTHNFVLKGNSFDSEKETNAVFVKNGDFLTDTRWNGLDNYTVVVIGNQAKEKLRLSLPRTEILTVSEIKGLERETVILYNLLSDNLDKWRALERTLVNRKTADENSVYRYYYNLFYVGLSRAKTNLYVYEEEKIASFIDFFKNNFEILSSNDAVSRLYNILSKSEVAQEELVERVGQFIMLEQYDNARFSANKLTDANIRTKQLLKIDINEQFVRFGKNRLAGIRYWELGMLKEAKEQFRLSEDTILINLVDSCITNDMEGLDINILRYYPEVRSNEVACQLIHNVVKEDYKKIFAEQARLSGKLKELKEKYNGK